MTVVSLLETGDNAIGLLAGLATPLWLLRPSGGVVWLNEAARQLLGRTVLPASAIGAELPEFDLRMLGEEHPLNYPVCFTVEGRRQTLNCRLIGTSGRGGEPLILAEAGGRAAECREAELSRDGVCTRKILRNAIESICEGFVLFDAQDRLVLCNSAYRRMHAMVTDLLLPGTRFDGILHSGVARGQFPDAAGQEDAWIARRLAYHQQPEGVFEQRLPDGRWVQVVERRTFDGGVVGTWIDITALKAREEEIKAAHAEAEYANKCKSDYVHHLSHELRTPLTAVMGFAQVIADDLLGRDGWPKYREYAGQIASAGSYMLDLINSPLDIAKIEAGRMELYEEACDLNLLIDMTLGLVYHRAAEAGITIQVKCADDLPAVRGDMAAIRQMLTNLLSNAIKFCPAENGFVTISAQLSAEGGVVLEVGDNGIGMSPEQIPLALEAFGQIQDREIARERGTGLGLPLTRALIELHGGRLELDSAPGEGTTVRLFFPASRVVHWE